MDTLSNQPSSVKSCKTCGIEKNLSEFYTKGVGPNGKTYYEVLCKECSKAYSRRKGKAFRATHKNNESYLERQREISRKSYYRRRDDVLQRERNIVRDSKRADKKRKMDHDLTVDFVREAIKNGCSYCGDQSIMMTMDRIDNTIGHTVENCVPACIRCNLVRGSMPHPAWSHVSSAIRSARELGLFGEWTGEFSFRKTYKA